MHFSWLWTYRVVNVLTILRSFSLTKHTLRIAFLQPVCRSFKKMPYLDVKCKLLSVSLLIKMAFVIHSFQFLITVESHCLYSGLAPRWRRKGHAIRVCTRLHSVRRAVPDWLFMTKKSLSRHLQHIDVVVLFLKRLSAMMFFFAINIYTNRYRMLYACLFGL